RVSGDPLVDRCAHVAVVVGVDKERWFRALVPVIVERPGWADDHVPALHGVGLVVAHKDGLLGSLAHQPGLAPHVAMTLRALARHEDLYVHPDRPAPGLDHGDRPHDRTTAGPNLPAL